MNDFFNFSDGRSHYASLLFLFEPLGNLFQKFADLQMLRTCLLAFSTLHTVGCFSVVYGMHVVVVIICIPVMIDLFGVHAGKELRDGDVFRAAVDAVSAGCTWNQVFAVDDISDFLYCCMLFLCQRFEVFHEA